MADADRTCTITVDADDKGFELSKPLVTRTSVPFSAVLDNSTDFPAGTYRLALTYKGRVVAQAGCSLAAGDLTGTLNCNTDEIVELHDILRARRLTLDLTLVNETSAHVFAWGPVDVLAGQYVVGGSDPTPLASDYYTGTEAVTEGTSVLTVDISGLGLTAEPDQVFATVAGGDGNLFARVASASATEIAFELSGNAGADTELHWMFFT